MEAHEKTVQSRARPDWTRRNERAGMNASSLRRAKESANFLSAPRTSCCAVSSGPGESTVVPGRACASLSSAACARMGAQNKDGRTSVQLWSCREIAQLH
eukprot:4946511-Pleurochrysis_carterae.AAC.2